MQARNTATNSFSEGLIMDFAPDNTQANTLTNALNATLLTYNGNEMSLLNDMGNCRVESAYLPQGYIPVGTCEFGDIIYIVSYNPLENKSQIGCFPSPERNISSKEISPLKQLINPQDLAAEGKISAHSIKRVIFGSSKLNAGDKFIISWGKEGVKNKNYISNFGNNKHNIKTVESYWPKLTKISVISIDDFGTIKELDSDMKWYDNKGSDFIISKETLDTTDSWVASLDQYRHALQCNYSVFQSKVSGKLALLLELETIKSFSCGHKVIKRPEKGEDYYDVYLSASWETDNYNINPMGMLITESSADGLEVCKSEEPEEPKLNKLTLDEEQNNIENIIPFSRIYKMEEPGENYNEFKENSYYSNYKKYTDFKTGFKYASYYSLSEGFPVVISVKQAYDNKNVPYSTEDYGNYVPSYFYKENNQYKYNYRSEIICTPSPIPDDVVVNTFHQQVLKKVASVKKTKDIGWIDYTVCPCMPYGPLESLKVSGRINFNKSYTNEIKLNKWQYYVNKDTLTLKFQFDSDLDEDREIEKITIDFYDDLGICALYLLKDLSTYNGLFIESIRLNDNPANFRVKNTNLGTSILHARSGSGVKLEDIKEKDREYYLLYDSQSNSFKKINFKEVSSETIVYPIDSGQLLYGLPYMAKITVYPIIVDANLELIDKLNPIYYYRWIWTAPVFNDRLTSKDDFNECQITQSFDFNFQIDGSGITTRTFDYFNPKLNEDSQSYNTLGAQVTRVQTKNNHIKITGTPGLSNHYNYLFLLDDLLYSNITVDYGIAKKEIIIPNTEILYENDISFEADCLYPRKDVDYNTSKYGKDLLKLLGVYNNFVSTEPDINDIYNSEKSYELYNDAYNASLPGAIPAGVYEVQYNDAQNNLCKDKLNMYKMTAANWNYTHGGIRLSLDGIKFNKIIAKNVKNTESEMILESLLSKKKNLKQYGLAKNASENYLYYKYLPYIGLEEGGGDPTYMTTGFLTYKNRVDSKFTVLRNGNTEIDDMKTNFLDEVFSAFHIKTFITLYPFIPIILGRSIKERGTVENIYLSVDCSKLTNKMGYESVSGDKITGGTPPYPNAPLHKGKRQEKENEDGVLVADGYGLPPFVEKTKYRNMYATLGFTYNGEFYGTADGAILNVAGTPSNTAYMSLNFAWKNNEGSVEGYAQIIGSLLSLLYVVNTSESIIQTSLENVARLKDFNETWKTRLILNLKPNFLSVNDLGNTATSQYIILNVPEKLNLSVDIESKEIWKLFYNLKSYTEEIINKLGFTKDSLIKNTDIKYININPLFMESPRCIEVEYQVPYNIESIKSIYQQSSSSVLLKQTVFDTNKYKVEYIPIVGSYDINKLYIYNGSNTLYPFSSGAQLKLIKSVYETEDDDKNLIIELNPNKNLELNPNSGLADTLKYNGNTLYIDDIEKLTGNKHTYYFKVDTHGGDPRITDLRRINLFKYGLFL